MNKPLSIALAIKARCRECCNGHNPRTHCVSIDCPLFPYKCGKKETDIPKLIENTKDAILRENLLKNWDKSQRKKHFSQDTRLQAIKERCKDCAFEGNVKACKFTVCPLYSFRLGKNQNLPKRPISQERKNVLLKNLKLPSLGEKK